MSKVTLGSNGVPCIDARLLKRTRCELGECILYDDETDTLLWTDILGSKFHKLPLSGITALVVETFATPRLLGAFALLSQQKRGYLCAWEDGFQVYDIEDRTPLSEMSVGQDVNPKKLPSRLNDGRCHPDGTRFICGGHCGELPNTTMKVYAVESDNEGKLKHVPIREGIRTTNSICFSNDGKTMYLADSPTKCIESFDYDKRTGKISNQTLVHQTPLGVPDGSCVDTEGYLWNAVWRSGNGPSMVNRIDPKTGDIVFCVRMPDGTSQVTCCCFGGKGLARLFISTAADSTDSSKEPNAGGVYVADVGVSGRKEARFIWHNSS